MCAHTLGHVAASEWRCADTRCGLLAATRSRAVFRGKLSNSSRPSGFVCLHRGLCCAHERLEYIISLPHTIPCVACPLWRIARSREPSAKSTRPCSTREWSWVVCRSPPTSSPSSLALQQTTKRLTKCTRCRGVCAFHAPFVPLWGVRLGLPQGEGVWLRACGCARCQSPVRLWFRARQPWPAGRVCYQA